MLLSLFLLLLAQDVRPAPPTNAIADLPAAIELAQEGRNAEALAALQKIAAANPDDHVARLWIAQVHDRMGRPDLAEVVYHSIVLEDPRNVDALLGSGTTLLEQDQIDAAIDMLTRAEQLAPQNPNVLAAMASAYRMAGRTDQSLTYYQRVATLSPTPANRLALENARRERGHRFESQTYDEHFNGNADDTRGSDLAVNLRVSETFRAIGRGQIQTKFDRREHREGGGAEWRVNPSTVLTGQALVGTGNRVLPQHDYLGRLDYGYHRTTWTGTVRYFDFFGANVTMVAPAVTFAPTSRWTVGLRYAITSTTTDAVAGVRGTSVDIRAAHEIRPRVWARGGYVRGVENFDNFSSDRIGDFHANTWTGAVQILLPSLTSIVGTYDYQRREDGLHMGRINIGLVQGF